MNVRSLALPASSTMLLVVSLIAAGSTVKDARAQWVQTAGPYGGPINAMAVLGANTSRPLLFAGTGSGIFRSTDSGAQWVNVTAGLTNTNTGSFAVMDTDVFAVTTGGVLRSTNGGTIWRYVNNGLTSDQLAQPICAMGTNLFVATYSQIFRSSNRGASWLAVDSIPGPSGGYNYINAFASIGTSLFAATNTSVFRSLDSGKSWTDLGSALGSYGISSLAVGGMNGSPALLYAGYGDSIYLSMDSGTSWASLNVPGAYSYYQLYSLIAHGSNLYIGTDNGFYSSSDQGQTWTTTNYELAGITVEAIAIMDTARAGIPATLFVGTSTGISESMDGGANWLAANTGLTIANVTSFAVLGPDVFAGTNSNVFLSSDDGGSWQPLSLNGNVSQINQGVTALTTDGQALFAAPQNNSGILVSNDSGMTWINPSSGNYYSATINALFPEVESSGTTLFEGTSGGIFQSPDEGTTLVSASTGLLADDLNVYSFAQNNADLYCGTINGGVFHSSDSGEIWNDISTSNSTSTNIQALAVSGTAIFAGMSDPYGLGGGGGVLLSTDNGMNWNTEDGTANVAALLAIGKNVFAATDAGISLSTNGGTMWSDVGEGLNGAAITALAVRGPYLYAGTTGAGVWRRPLGEMIDLSSVTTNMPFAAAQGNYPNPFTTQTTIPFSLSHSGHVTVKIFDMLGNEIATLANQDMGAGPQEVEWNAGAALPGMYLYRITTSEGVQAHTIVLEGSTR